MRHIHHPLSPELRALLVGLARAGMDENQKFVDSYALNLSEARALRADAVAYYREKLDPLGILPSEWELGTAAVPPELPTVQYDLLVAPALDPERAGRSGND